MKIPYLDFITTHPIVSIFTAFGSILLAIFGFQSIMTTMQQIISLESIFGTTTIAILLYIYLKYKGIL